ncbi:11338_t:CDS:2, partial [Racocetra persica]
SLDINAYGNNGKYYILLIIANTFSYEEIKENLKISHAINRYIHLGFDISEGQNIENAIQNIRGTSVTNLKLNRDRASNGKNSLPGNSNWFEWQWPITGKFAEYILAHAIPNIKNWKIFSPADLEKLCKKDIYKPNPEISTHTTPCSDWEIPIPNTSPSEADKSDRYTAQDMYEALQQRVLEGKIEAEAIPK